MVNNNKQRYRQHPLMRLTRNEQRKISKIMDNMTGLPMPKHPISYRDQALAIAKGRERAFLEAYKVMLPTNGLYLWRQFKKWVWWHLRYRVEKGVK